jgi:hypothetical protein
MQDYYSIYTWAMDKQAEMQRDASRRRMVRRAKPVTVHLQWPLVIRRDDR